MSKTAAHLLTRQNRSRRKSVILGDGISLSLARVHEVCGPARYTLAMLIAKQTQGPVFWIVPEWTTDRPHPDGTFPFMDPARLTFLSPKRAEDVLWTIEEVLRSGVVPLVIADLPAPPALTPIRRLHLAAETGTQDGDCSPLGILMTPDQGGAPGVESRWHMSGRHIAEGNRWRLTRNRYRTLPPKTWTMTLAPHDLAITLDAQIETEGETAGPLG